MKNQEKAQTIRRAAGHALMKFAHEGCSEADQTHIQQISKLSEPALAIFYDELQERLS